MLSKVLLVSLFAAVAVAAPALYPLVRGRAVCEPSEVVRLKTDGKTLDDDLG